MKAMKAMRILSVALVLWTSACGDPSTFGDDAQPNLEELNRRFGFEPNRPMNV